MMVSAVGSSPASSAVSTAAASTAGIEAQIARDKKELSNCLNCDSAKTKQGQADIQALSNKISIAEARLQQITAANPVNQSAALSPAAASDSVADSNTVASTAESNAGDESATTLHSSDSNTGRYVDVFV
jgi:hypothetical protein